MTAEDARASLFARVPASLKKQLKTSASARGTSMSREVERMLRQQQVLPFRGEGAEELRIVRGQLQLIETAILSLPVTPDSAIVAASVKAMQDTVLKVSRLRKKNDLEIKRMLARHTLDSVAAIDPCDPLFGALRKDARISAIPRQLERHERRRTSLVAILDKSPRGTRAALARYLECEASFVSQLSSGHRRINSEVARQIEMFFARPVGELDRIEPKPDLADVQVAFSELAKATRSLKRRPRR